MAKDYTAIDARILEAILAFQGIPTSRVLQEPTGLSNTFISTRLKSDRLKPNPILVPAQETRGLAYINGLSIEELKEQSAQKGSLILSCSDHPKLLSRIYERIDAEIILPAIQDFRGIPTPAALQEPTGFRNESISNRLKSDRLKPNPILVPAQETRGLAYINGLSIEELKEQSSKIGSGLATLCQGHPKLLSRIYERIDAEILLPAIQDFPGIPTPYALKKPTGFSGQFISGRFQDNPTLAQAQETRGLAYINGLSIEELKEQSAKRNGLTNHCKGYPKLLSRIYERIDTEIILPAIKSFQGIPGSKALHKPTGFSGVFILSRLQSNPLLFAAMAKKQGLTIDQVLELALERRERTPAVRALFEQHLTDLWAFREMVALIRVFSDVFAKTRQVWEATLYPQPLERALAMERYDPPMRHVDLNDFEPSTALRIGLEASAGVIAVVQSIHRLSEAQLNRLLEELHSVLPVDSHVLLTYSIRHALLEGAVAALEIKGFQLQEQGLIHVELPDEIPVNLPADEAARVRKKIEGSSNVLHLVTQAQASVALVPALARIPAIGGARPSPEGSGDEIRIPQETLPRMHASFAITGLEQLPDKPFLVTVVDDTNQPLALLGFDMHPNRRRTVETQPYPLARELDVNFRAEAGKLARNAGHRSQLGVVPGRETRVPLTRLQPAR